MEIRDIRLDDIDIGDVKIPEVRDWVVSPPAAVPAATPIVNQVGVPIVDIPGCVEAHESNNKSNVVGDDDPKGLVTYCDGNMPSFQAPDYEPNRMTFTGPPAVAPKLKQPEFPAPEVPKTPEVKPPVNTIKCPTAAQLAKEPVGFIFDGGRKEVTGYKLVGTQCIREVRDVPLVEQAINGIPPAGIVITTGGIAVVAATSALLAKPFADILLKIIKPTVKKVVKKIAAIRGKQTPVLSLKERRDLQRERTEAIRKLKSVLKPKG